MRVLRFLFLPAIIYQGLTIASALRHRRKRSLRDARFQPPVSVLKPLRGVDPNTYEAFVSQARQDYPEFELLFGVADEYDPAAAEVRRLQQEFPHVPVRLITGRMPAQNGKVGVLLQLARFARHSIWVVNDGDIKVGSDYLSEVTAPLADPAVGVVTCPYRVNAHTLPAAWEALGIATHFIPSTLVGHLLGVREFGLGSTLAFRAVDLEQAGGFQALIDFLADDYQLAKHITALGKHGVLSSYVVETSLSEATWRGVWHHQLRWARTIRVSKGAGYTGLPITHAGLWAVIAAASGAWPTAGVLVTLRVLSAFLATGLVLRSPRTAALCWLSPLWDLYSFAVWLASYAGRQVRWRDCALVIDSQGRISARIETA